jgi:hypothetical protein
LRLFLNLTFSIRGVTKRPIHVNIINNADYEQPHIILKRDPALKQFDSDKVVPLAALEAELQQRNVISSIPIIINVEHRNCWNVTYIDTPGLFAPKTKVNGDVS